MQFEKQTCSVLVCSNIRFLSLIFCMSQKLFLYVFFTINILCHACFRVCFVYNNHVKCFFFTLTEHKQSIEHTIDVKYITVYSSI